MPSLKQNGEESSRTGHYHDGVIAPRSLDQEMRNMSLTLSRRDVLRTALCSAGAMIAFPRLASAADAQPLTERLALFTDHLDDFGYSYAEVAGMLRPLGIAGPDLTVRAGGLVPPERAADELPKAAAAFRDQGMSIPMISTNLTHAGDPTAKPILSTMDKLDIRYFKLGYLHYHDLAKYAEEIESERTKLAGLVALAKEHGVQAGFHNHSGAGIGGAIWDAWDLLQPLDADAIGFYFDSGHSSIEGAKHTWKLNLQRVAPRLKMIALKDYVWEKSSGGWQPRWVPLGEGMVNWNEFFPQLVKHPFAGPISIHLEYDPGGKTRPERIDNNLAAAQKDVAFVKRHLEAALKSS